MFIISSPLTLCAKMKPVITQTLENISIFYKTKYVKNNFASYVNLRFWQEIEKIHKQTSNSVRNYQFF